MKCRICPATQHSCYTVFFFSDWKIQAPDGKLISDREQERGEGDEEQTGGRTGWTSLNFIKVPCSQSLYILHCFLSLFRTYQMRYWVYHYRLKKVHPDCTHVNYLLRVSDQTSERSKGLLDCSLYIFFVFSQCFCLCRWKTLDERVWALSAWVFIPQDIQIYSNSITQGHCIG